MRGLQDLPPEILLSIIEYFESSFESEYISLLRSLCLSSRRLYALAQPVLFKSYTLALDYIVWSKGKQISPSGVVSLLCFTRTLLSRPDLGECVRRVTIDGFRWEPTEPETWSKTLTPETIALLAKGIQDLPIDNKARFFSSLIGAKVTSLTALLLSQTPNLQSLNVTLKREEMMELGALLTASTQRGFVSGYLSNLRDVSFEGEPFKLGEVSFEVISQLLCLPHLDHLSASHLRVQGAGSSASTSPSRLSPLVSLSFHHCYLDTGDLEILIHSCKGLKKIVYEAASETSPQFFSALQSQKETLEVVKVDLDFTNPSLVQWEDYPKFQSLASFRSLRQLEIEQCFLNDDPELPDSLKGLVIRACEYPVFNLVANLTRRCHSDLKSLQLVLLQAQSSQSSGLLGFARTVDGVKIIQGPGYWYAARRACEELERVTRGAMFNPNIHAADRFIYLQNPVD